MEEHKPAVLGMVKLPMMFANEEGYLSYLRVTIDSNVPGEGQLTISQHYFYNRKTQQSSQQQDPGDRRLSRKSLLVP